MALGPSESGLKPWQFLAYELCLDLTRVDADALSIRQRRLDEAGIAVVSLAGEYARDPSALERVYALHDRCFRRQPPLGARETPIPFHLWAWGSLEANEEALPEAYFIARQAGRYIGLSTVVRQRRLPGVLQSRFTGVLAEHEGLGIAGGLKAATVRYALDAGYREIRTTVLAENAGMLRVNESLGFVRVREFVQSYPLIKVDDGSELWPAG